MHLINIKRVAYGIVECKGMADNDPTFNHAAELAAIGEGGGAPAQSVVTPVITPTPVTPAPAAPAPTPVNQSGFISYSPTCGACGSSFDLNNIVNAPSPQSLQNGGNTAPAVNNVPAAAPAVDDGPGIDTQQLNAMIESMTKALKGE